MPTNAVLILANGEWGATTRLASLVDRVDRVIATDGAWAKADTAGIHVDCVVGDLDSLSPEQRTALLESDVEVQIHSREKDFTDLELAVDSALELSARRMILFGAFGGRIDHTLANLLMLEKAVAQGVEVELIADEETAWLIQDGLTLPLGRAGDRVSLIPLSGTVVLRTDGLQYRLNDEPLVRASAHGVSNVIESLPVRIEVSSGTLLVVHGPREEAP